MMHRIGIILLLAAIAGAARISVPDAALFPFEDISKHTVSSARGGVSPFSDLVVRVSKSG